MPAGIALVKGTTKCNYHLVDAIKPPPLWEVSSRRYTTTAASSNDLFFLVPPPDLDEDEDE